MARRGKNSREIEAAHNAAGADLAPEVRIAGAGRNGVSGGSGRKRSMKAPPASINGRAQVAGRTSQAAASADNRTRPIGVFDSGIGGLTVLKELTALLPGRISSILAIRRGCLMARSPTK